MHLISSNVNKSIGYYLYHYIVDYSFLSCLKYILLKILKKKDIHACKHTHKKINIYRYTNKHIYIDGQPMCNYL